MMRQMHFVATDMLDILQRHHLDSFDALWQVEAEWVDEPNRSRGGHSSVSRLALEDGQGGIQVFYLKRQSNYLIRHMRRPLGEPTAAREFYNIQRFERLGIPALEAACYAERRQAGEHQAILLTRDLTGYQPLDQWFDRWSELSYRQQDALLIASADLVARMHARSIVHNCLYPKHIFIKSMADGVQASLIDLEKSRAHVFSPWGRMRDLDALNRRSDAPRRTQRLRFLLLYLGKQRVDAEVRYWVTRVARRSMKKREQRAARQVRA